MNSKKQFQICRLGAQPVVCFAAEELARYLSEMTKHPVPAQYTNVFSRDAKVLYVGEVKDFATLDIGVPCEVSAWDDALESRAVEGVAQAIEFLNTTEKESFWALDLHSTHHRLGQLKLKYAE